MAKIKLSDLKSGSIDWQELSAFLKQVISTELLVNGSEYEVVRECMKYINFRNTSTDITTIRKQAARVLRLTIFRKGIRERDKVFKHFIATILRYKELPTLYKNIIEKEVKKDFLKLNDLVAYYRSKSFIKQYEIEGIVPRNHEDRTLLVFYKRALEKREQVIQFIYSSIDELSLSAARRSFYSDFVSENEAMDILHSHTYYPYRKGYFNNNYVHGVDYELLDYRLINPFRNKLFINGISDKIDSGYTYTELNNILLKINTNTYISYIINTTVILPGISKRKEVFNELQYIFSKKKWYSFYALALPQIEGLFSDIISIAFPGKSMNGALTDKVDSVRPLYGLSEKFFDYYQYYLPNQRNKFAHTGHDVDIKAKAYHALFDLWFLINAFYNLDLPLLEVIRITKEGRSYFEHIGKLAHFINLLRKINLSNGFIDKEESINTFFKNYFMNTLNIDRFLNLLQYDLDEAFIKFSKKFSDIAYIWTKEEIKFDSMSKGELYSKMDAIKQALPHSIVDFDDEIKLLTDANDFIRNIKSSFKNVLPAITLKTDAFYAKNKEVLDKISLLNPEKIEGFEINDYFLFLNKKKWSHMDAL